MPSTDIDGSPILILSLEEAALAHQIVKNCGYNFGCVKRLEARISRFLEEADSTLDIAAEDLESFLRKK
jgi:hypothetical protein